MPPRPSSSLFLACVLLGCPRGSEPLARHAPAIPATTTTPQDDRLATPPLGALSGNLDLSLTRSITTFDVEVDVSVLNEVDSGNWNAMFQQLAADPRWRVTEYQNAIVALQRIPDPDGRWTLPRHGYHTDASGYTWRALLRFTAWDHDHPWADSETIARVPASSSSLTLAPVLVQREPWLGQHVTALVVEGRDLSLEIHEIGPPDSRPNTFEKLGTVPQFVSNALSRLEAIRAVGFDRMLLPLGEPGADPSVMVQAREGLLTLRARLNPGEPGWSWARITRKKHVWNEAAVAAATREAVGYSTDPSELFLMQGEIPIPKGLALDGTLEIWFQPADRAGTVRKLSSTALSL